MNSCGAIWEDPIQQACGFQEALYQLLRIAGLLEALPLPPRSPQADMVAASISQRATLQEREVTRTPLSEGWSAGTQCFQTSSI